MEGAFNAALALPYAFIFFDSKSSKVRLVVFNINVFIDVMIVLLTLIGIIVTSIKWKDIMASCEDSTDSYHGFFEEYYKLGDDVEPSKCRHLLTRSIWLFFSVTLLILIPIKIGVDRILYWGWKQREFIEIAEQAESNYL